MNRRPILSVRWYEMILGHKSISVQVNREDTADDQEVNNTPISMLAKWPWFSFSVEDAVLLQS